MKQREWLKQGVYGDVFRTDLICEHLPTDFQRIAIFQNSRVERSVETKRKQVMNKKMGSANLKTKRKPVAIFSNRLYNMYMVTS